MTGAPAPRRHLSVQGMQAFLIVWLGQVISIIGSGLTAFALGVWMYERTGQATPFALTVLFAGLPRVLIAPLAGSLADRWNRRWVMIVADTGSALVTLGAVTLVATGRLVIWHVYAIALLGAVFAAFQEPAYLASIAMLVTEEQLGRANGLVEAARAVELLISPLLAGALFGLIGMRGIFLIDFASYFIAVGALLLVAIPQPRREISPDGGSGTLSDVTYGWRYLWARPGLFGLLLYFALVNFLLGLVGVLVGPLVLSFASPLVLGAIQTAAGASMLLGSVLISVWGGPRRRILGVVGALAAAAGGVLVMGLQSSGLLIGVGMALFLFFIPVASSSSQAIFQTKVAPGVQGRVFAARSMIARSITPIAHLVAGPLADRVFEPRLRAGHPLAETVLGRLIGTGPGRGIGLVFVGSGLLLLGASALAWLNPRIRHVESELPDADATSGEDPVAVVSVVLAR
jgi:MFS transporter, DHA3 family, macrolide efflux protein